jgi:ribosomal protein S18 acetylase RimI-like enzyme
LSINIRTFRESDRELLKDITERTFDKVSIDAAIEERYGLVGTNNWAARKRRHIDWDCDANPDGIFVAEDDGKVIGYITTRVDRETDIGWIPNLAVDPASQGKGVGKQLMDAALQYLRDEGMQGVRIETLAHNPVGTKFYPQVGFVEVARQVHYFMKL